ncbi:MAG: YibE/F family protein [Geodermatophilaceae bacterium]|nr:YibE/F family protein [Geodermatophilaceae bacterium]
MGHSHGGSETAPSPWMIAQRRRVSIVLALILGPIALITVVGLVVLWPDGDQTAARQAATSTVLPGSTFVDASVISVSPFDCSVPGGLVATPLTCADLVVRVEEGPDAGTSVQVQVPAEVYLAGFTAGDRLVLQRSLPVADSPVTYSFTDFARQSPLTWLALAFAVAIVAVARLRGLAALAGLGFAFAIFVLFMLPGLLNGESPLGVALIGSSAIMFVVLYLAHGFSARTTTALAGTLFGLAMVAGLALLAGGAARLTGLGSEETLTLTYLAGGVDPTGIVLCGIIVAGLGVLNDVTITQASAVWQLHETAPELPARQLFGRAMAIGRDHIASTVYTIVFAYAGAALPVLLILETLQRPFADIVTGEAVAEEVVRTMVGSIGLVLAVPVTTAIGVLLAKSVRPDAVKATARAR